MAQIKFITATAAQYAALKTKDDGTLYFLTDTGEIYKGSTHFSHPAKIVTAFPDTGEKGVLYVNSTTYAAKLWDGTSWINAVFPISADLSHGGSDSYIPTAKAARNYADKLSEHLAFAVFPCNVDIPAGAVSEMEETLQDLLVSVYGEWVLEQSFAVAVPAQMTHLFNIATVCKDLTKSDVIVDWGDGSRSVIASGEYHKAMEPGAYGQRNVVMKHTYQTPGRYVVKIFGQDYYALRQAVSETESGSPDLVREKCNLVCDCFSRDLPVPSFLKNGSSMFCYAHRLLQIEAAYCYPLRNITNGGNMFYGCRNLISVRNLTLRDSEGSYMSNMFSCCSNMVECSVAFPSMMESEYGMYETFAECTKLQKDIADFFPNRFVSRKITPKNVFAYCKALTGTVPAEYLWEDRNIEWVLNIDNDAKGSNRNGMFYGCSDAIRAQVPLSWGGTAADIQPAKHLAEAIDELETSLTWTALE